jgi:peptidoglycan/LPS O-acetylase OafA/YrhL
LNTSLWVLQVLLALHTFIGAMWKWSHSEMSVPSLGSIPHAGWLALIAFELVCAVGLLLPAIRRSTAWAAPAAAIGIALEMLLFALIHQHSGEGSRSQLLYWVIVAAICALIAWGRLTARQAVR